MTMRMRMTVVKIHGNEGASEVNQANKIYNNEEQTLKVLVLLICLSLIFVLEEKIIGTVFFFK